MHEKSIALWRDRHKPASISADRNGPAGRRRLRVQAGRTSGKAPALFEIDRASKRNSRGLTGFVERPYDTN